MFFSHRGNRGLRLGDWKLVSARIDQDRWGLCDLKTGRAESNDLSATHPEKLQEMIDRWQQLYDQYISDSKMVAENVR